MPTNFQLWRLAVVTLFAASISNPVSASSDCKPRAGYQELQTDNTIAPRAFAKIDSIIVAAPFSIDLYICQPSEAALTKVDVDAIMPAHKHGMNYTPQVEETSESTYRASGMLFHMPGAWRILVSTRTKTGRQDYWLDINAR